MMKTNVSLVLWFVVSVMSLHAQAPEMLAPDTVIVTLPMVQAKSDANVYDSLAEAYAKAGRKNLAISNYEHSLKLNPQNENARTQLKKL